MPLPDKPLFTVKEAAEYLGIPQPRSTSFAAPWSGLASLPFAWGGAFTYSARPLSAGLRRWLTRTPRGLTWAFGAEGAL